VIYTIITLEQGSILTPAPIQNEAIVVNTLLVYWKRA